MRYSVAQDAILEAASRLGFANWQSLPDQPQLQRELEDARDAVRLSHSSTVDGFRPFGVFAPCSVGAAVVLSLPYQPLAGAVGLLIIGLGACCAWRAQRVAAEHRSAAQRQAAIEWLIEATRRPDAD